MVLFSLRRVSKFWAETSNVFLACFSPSKRKLHMHAFYVSLQSNPRWLRAQTLCSCDLGPSSPPVPVHSEHLLPWILFTRAALCVWCAARTSGKPVTSQSVTNENTLYLPSPSYTHAPPPLFFLLHQQPLGAAILWFRSSLKERTKQSRWHFMGRTPREAGATVNKLNLPWLAGNKWDGNELKKKEKKKKNTDMW